MFDLSYVTPPSIVKWLAAFRPEKDMRLWMRGGVAPIGPYDVLDVLREENLIVPIDVRNGYIQRLLTDGVERWGYAEVGTPHFNVLPSTLPFFEFQDMDPGDEGTWNVAPQECSIRHLSWAFHQGVYQAGVLAAIAFLSYFRAGWYNQDVPILEARSKKEHWFRPEDEMRPSKWSYLRNGGDPKKRFGNRGRNRLFRGCLEYCNSMTEITTTANALDFAKEIKRYRDRLIDMAWESWPLVDDAAGDHLKVDGVPVDFFSVYQSASLATELHRTRGIISHELQDEDRDRRITVITSMLDDLLAIIKAAEHEVDGVIAFDYDVRFLGKKPDSISPILERVPGSQFNVGAFGVNQYLYHPLVMAHDHNASDRLRTHALTKIDRIKFPWVLPQYFGIV